MIYKNDETRQNVLDGAEVLYDAVRTTLGPKGRNVLIRDKFSGFTITHDGVTVAKAVQLRDDPKSVGVEIIKEASKQMDTIGDGTTTVTVLAYHLMLEGKKLIDAGMNPMVIKRELEAKVPELVEAIKAKIIKVEKSKDAVKQVATVSVGNEKLGEQIAELMEKVGFDGSVSVETSSAPEDSFKVVEGYTFDRGWLSPHFVSDPSSREAVLRNPAVILINARVDNLEDYKNVLDVLFSENITDVLIVADDFEADQLGTLILNKVRKTLNVAAVKTPGFGDAKLQNLKDIAAVTGATIIDPTIGDFENNLGMNTLGAAEKITVGFDETIIIGGKGNIPERVEKLKKQFKKLKEDQKPELEERIAKLNGSVGIIKVGGQTETEIEEKKYRIDDAVGAVKAAMKSGIVAGGGVTLRDIGLNILPETEVEGALRNVLQMPERVLFENSGIEIGEERIIKPGFGTNVITGEEVEMFEAGIVDPAEVTIEVVRNAITTACLAITVGGSIIEEQLTQEQMTALMSNVG